MVLVGDVGEGGGEMTAPGCFGALGVSSAVRLIDQIILSAEECIAPTPPPPTAPTTVLLARYVFWLSHKTSSAPPSVRLDRFL